MTAVVAESDGFGERDIEAKRASHRCCNLSDFNGMGEASSLVIVRKNKHLGFAGETSKRLGMQNAVTIAFETCAQWVGFFGNCSVARFARPGCETTQR